MAPKATIRLFLPVPAAYSKPAKNWASISLAYAQAFYESKLPVRAVSYAFGANFTSENPPWYEISDLFARELDDTYVNVVLGFGAIFPTYATTSCSHNIAITESFPREYRKEETKAFEGYDLLWATNTETRLNLFNLGRVALVVPPTPKDIIWALTDILENTNAD